MTERNNMKAVPWIIAVCATTLAGHFYLYSTSRIEQLEATVELESKARSIEGEQVRDLMFALQEQKRINEGLETRSYVQGVAAALKNPEELEKVWHAGYDRGTEVQMLAQQSEKKQQEESELGY